MVSQPRHPPIIVRRRYSRRILALYRCNVSRRTVGSPSARPRAPRTGEPERGARVAAAASEEGGAHRRERLHALRHMQGPTARGSVSRESAEVTFLAVAAAPHPPAMHPPRTHWSDRPRVDAPPARRAAQVLETRPRTVSLHSESSRRRESLT